MMLSIPNWLSGILNVWCLLLFTTMLRAQERTFHYHEQNGLLSDFTYSGMFDRNNYLWICTSRGLSRFNGTAFSHFTVREGLPDNDIVDVKEDADGVIWATAFHRETAFLEPGKTLFVNINTIIHPDTVKSDGKYEVFLLKNNTVALVSRWWIRLVRNKKWIRSYPAPKDISVPALFQNDAGELVVFHANKILLLHPSGTTDSLIQPYPFGWNQWEGSFLWLRCKDNSLVCLDTRKGRAGTLARKITAPDSVFRFGTWGDSILISEKNGRFIRMHNSSGAFSVFPKPLLLSGTAESKDGHVKVILTRDEGIYVHVRAGSGLYHELPAAPYSMLRQGNRIEILDAQNRWLFPERLRGTQLPVSVNRVVPEFTEVKEDKTWIYGFDLEVGTPGGSLKKLGSVVNIKDVYILNDSIRYLACHHGAFAINCLRQTEFKLYNKRVCSISEGPDTSVCMGTQRGLLQRLADGRLIDWRDSDFPDIRVTDLAFKNNILWIGTGGKGLWAIWNNRLYFMLDENRGLVSDDIEAISVDGNGHVLLGYSKGVQRLSYSLQQDGIQITELLTVHTAKGEGIKYLHYAGGKVYGMGSRGLLIVPEQLQEPIKNFRIQTDRVVIDGIPTEFSRKYMLPTGLHDFYASFSVVNYEQFPIRYRYRNNDEAWTYTSEPEISYHGLGAGDYRIEIQALNNYAKPSSVQVFQIEVQRPFYLRTGFILTATGALIVLLIAGTRFWYRYKYRKAQRTREQETRLRELELAALKAQINPHFVFNCLNSIKGLIYQEQLEEADVYMDHFASLFRGILEGAATPYHSLLKEIAFINAYLSLEQFSVNNRFVFDISLQPGLQPDIVMIPPMLLQPYAENAVKHGVARLKDRKGRIIICFEKEKDELICTISDNGVGRNSNSGKRRDGKGMQISGKRALLYNIQTEIADNTPCGTIVRLKLLLKQTKAND